MNQYKRIGAYTLTLSMLAPLLSGCTELMLQEDYPSNYAPARYSNEYNYPQQTHIQQTHIQQNVQQNNIKQSQKTYNYYDQQAQAHAAQQAYAAQQAHATQQAREQQIASDHAMAVRLQEEEYRAAGH